MLAVYSSISIHQFANYWLIQRERTKPTAPFSKHASLWPDSPTCGHSFTHSCLFLQWSNNQFYFTFLLRLDAKPWTIFDANILLHQVPTFFKILASSYSNYTYGWEKNLGYAELKTQILMSGLVSTSKSEILPDLTSRMGKATSCAGTEHQHWT